MMLLLRRTLVLQQVIEQVKQLYKWDNTIAKSNQIIKLQLAVRRLKAVRPLARCNINDERKENEITHHWSLIIHQYKCATQQKMTRDIKLGT